MGRLVRVAQPLPHPVLVVPAEPLQVRPQHRGPQFGHRLDIVS
jgi:hypothetical protein